MLHNNVQITDHTHRTAGLDFGRKLKEKANGEGKEQPMNQSGTPSVKHGGGSVLTWACISANEASSWLPDFSFH